MRKKRAIAILATILFIALTSPFAAAQDVPGDATTPAPGLRSQAELDAYLKSHAGQSTPFDALSAGARERFFMSLEWRGDSVSRFDFDDLSDDALTDDQVRALLALFGPEIAADAPVTGGRSPGFHATRDRASIADFERRYNRFYRDMLASDGSTDAMSAAVRTFDTSLSEAFDSRALGHLEDHDLALLENAAHDIVEYASSDDRHVDALRNVVMELDHRGLAGANDLQQLHDALLIVHRHDQARQLGELHPDAGLPPLPAFQDTLKDAHGPTFWRMDRDGTTLTRTTFDPSATQILVTAGCHFSQDAAQDISADPVLGPVFAAHALWLVQAPGMEDIEAVRDWNRRFPAAPAVMIHDRAEWSLLPPGWTMPHFFIVRDGKVVATDTGGWSHESLAGERLRLTTFLRRAGLIDGEEGAVTR